MKQFLSLITALVLLLGVPFVPIFDKDNVRAESPTYRPTAIDLTTREDFGFGVNVHQKSYSAYPENLLEEQIRSVAKLGSKWIRMNLDVPEDGDWSYFDACVGLANKYGLKIVATIYPSRTVSNEYITLYCETISERYNGKDGRGFVDVFQVWNEVDLVLMQAKWGGSPDSGESENSYFNISVSGPENDLIDWLAFFKAAEKGIHSNKSHSAFLINFSATHYGMIAYMLKNGLKLDYFGWDQYSYYPYDLEESAKKLEETLDKIETSIVKKYDVPCIVCETNINVSQLTNDDQENPTEGTYEALIDYMYMFYTRSWIKSAIFYELLDEPAYKSSSLPYEAYFGLLQNPDGGIGVSDSKYEKPIYKKIQTLLKGNPNIRKIKRSELNLKPYEKFIVDTADDSNVGSKIQKGNNPEITFENIPEIDFGDQDAYLDTDFLGNDEMNASENVVTPVRDVKTRETSYKIPWGFVVGVGSGILASSAGVLFLYMLITRKKEKKTL